MKLNSTNKTIITVAALTLVAILIVVFIILPTSKNIKKITEETYNLRAYMEQKYKKSLNSKLTKKKLIDIEKGSKHFDKYLFSRKNALKLIKFLEDLSQNSNVKQNIRSSNLDEIKKGNLVKISTTITGNYHDVLNYIHNLETSQYFINIKDIRLTPRSGEKEKQGMAAKLNLELYAGK